MKKKVSRQYHPLIIHYAILFHYFLFATGNLTNPTASPSSSVIKPGSRPSSKFDYDPSVLCSENPYPTLCKNALNDQNTRAKYMTNYSDDGISWMTKEVQELSCLDFYNQSDGKLIWWQELRKNALFYPPRYLDYSMENNNECANHQRFDYYVNDRNDTEKIYVEWQRGKRLGKRNKNSTNTVYVCYFTEHPPQNSNYQLSIMSSFLYCLLFYGKLVDLILIIH